MKHTALRRTVVATVAAALALLIAAPAAAHVEVSADKPQAGARDVTVTFKGAAESDTAGIVSERVVLPAGIAPADVKLASAPPGWTFTAATDGYTVAGPTLPVGTDAVHAVLIAQLPTNATTLAFRLLESYSDGKISRWIEIPEPGKPEPDTPAPVLTLQPAAAPAPATSSAAPVTREPSSPAAIAEPAPTPTGSDGSSSVWIIWAVVAGLIVLGGLGFLLVRYRRTLPEA